MRRPTAAAERIAAIDALRGVALLGILLANVRQMFLPWNAARFALPGRYGQAAGWVDWGFFHAFVDLKFLTLFSLLFGAGFALQARRLSAPDHGFGAVYFRRLLFLAVLGAAHALLFYPADVLLPYAVGAVMLYFIRGLGTTNLFRVGVVLVATTIAWGYQIGSLGHVSVPATCATIAALCLAVLPWERGWRRCLVAVAAILVVSAAVLTWISDPAERGLSVADQARQAAADLAAMHSADPAHWPAEFAVREQRSFQALVQLRAGQYLDVLAFFAVLLIWRTLGLFMIGAALVKSGALTGITAETWRRVSVTGLGIGVPATLLATWLQAREIEGLTDWRWPEWLHVASAFPLALGFAARVMMNEGLGRRRRWYGLMESAGRMPLTNYIGQSLVMATLAEPWGFGLYGRMSGPGLTALAFVVFTGLAALSRAWLVRYRIGPLEWVWRSFTYWARLPLRS